MLASITQNGANGIGEALMAEPHGPERVRSLTRLSFSVTGIIRYRIFRRALFRDHLRHFVLYIYIYNDNFLFNRILIDGKSKLSTIFDVRKNG